MKRVGCLFLPYFLASVTIKVNPHLREQPVAVFREGKVVGVSPELRDQFLIGLSLTRARGRCPVKLGLSVFIRVIRTMTHNIFLPTF